MDAEEVVSHVGLWWPAADEDGLRRAAAAWDSTSAELTRAADVGRAGASQARQHWSGDAAERFEQSWRDHEKTLRDDAAACSALADGLRRYADAVAEAKYRVEELAVTAGATIVAGIGLAWLTLGTSAAVAGEVTASLVSMAAAIGVELSSTAAAIGATALVGATFGAAEAAVVDMAVTQPLRVEVFHDRGYSAAEVGDSAAQGGVFGGLLGGAAGSSAVAPMSRVEAGQLGAVRAPGGAIRAALDPVNWGSQGTRFRPGVHPAPGVKFKPHELSAAQFRATDGSSVHLRPSNLADGTPSPDALVRSSSADPGTYTEFKTIRRNNDQPVIRSLREAEAQLSPWGGGEVVVDGRQVGLTENVARDAVARAVGAARAGGKPIPSRSLIILGDGRTLRTDSEGVVRVD